MSRQDIEARREYHHLEAMRARSEAQEFIRRAEEHEVKVRAYDLVLQDLSPLLDEGVHAAASVSSNRAGSSGTLMEAVRKAVEPQQDSFTLGDVQQTLHELAPGLLDSMTDRNALSKALSRMALKNEIWILRKGQGKRPALYSKKNPNLAPVSLARFAGQDVDRADDDRPQGGGE